MFINFVLWAKLFRNSLKNFRRVCNHSIRRIYRNVLRKNKKWILRKKINFFIILGDCEENFGVVVNTAFTEEMGSLCRSFFWIICFLTFLHTERKLFGLSSKTLRRGFNHCILRIHRNVLRKNKTGFFEKKFNFFFRRLQGKIRRGGQHCIQRDNRIFMQIIFWIICFFKRFCKLSETISAFRRKLFSDFAITTFIVSIGSFWGKIRNGFFEKMYNFYILHGNCKGSFHEVVNTAFTETIGCLCRPFFWNTRFLTNFVLWAKNFQLFLENSSARL